MQNVNNILGELLISPMHIESNYAKGGAGLRGLSEDIIQRGDHLLVPWLLDTGDNQALRDDLILVVLELDDGHRLTCDALVEEGHDWPTPI